MARNSRRRRRPTRRPTGRKLLSRDYGYTPSQAAQLINISANLSQYIDTPEFDQLPDLPDDLFKLSWLSRLPIGEIREVLEQMNCRTCKPRQLMNEVKRRLNHLAVLKAWDKFKANAVAAVQGMTDDVRARLKDDLAGRFDEIDEILQRPLCSGG